MKTKKLKNNNVQNTAKEYFEKVHSGEIKFDEIYTNITDEELDNFLQCLNIDIHEIKINRDESD